MEIWLPEFMSAVSDLIGLRLQAETDANKLGIHTWRAHETFHGAWAGQISVQLDGEDEVKAINAALHGKAVEIMGHHATIAVDSKYINVGIFA